MGEQQKSPIREVTPGVWEYAGVHAPMAVIRFLRHEGRPCYRATKWRADGEVGELIGYYDFLNLAISAVAAAVQSYYRAVRGEWTGPNARPADYRPDAVW